MLNALNQVRKDRRTVLITAVTAALLKPALAWSQGTPGLPGLKIEVGEKSAVITLEQLSGSHNVSSFSISEPPRFVIDIEGIVLTPEITSRLKIPVNDNPFVNRVAVSQFNKNTARVVINLRERLFARTQQTSGQESGFRTFSAELRLPKGAKQLESKPVPAVSQAPEAPKPQSQQASEPEALAKKVLVLIDPGHGGNDPGVIGILGTREKDLSLETAKKLASKLAKVPGVSVELTRNGDSSVSISQRLEKIRALKPALVVSLHADRHLLPKSIGPRVFYFAQAATSPSAELIAQRENGSAHATAVATDAKTRSATPALANEVQAALAKKQSITAAAEGAPFSVLALSAGNGVLVQLGNLENRTDEAQLRSAAYQEELATLLYQGLIGTPELARLGKN